jgi:hypothetical protein
MILDLDPNVSLVMLHRPDRTKMPSIESRIQMGVL